MNKHTPWHKENPHDEPYYEIWYGKIGDKDRELIAEYVSKDNAEFIVKACNSHAELYEACNLAQKTFIRLVKNTPRLYHDVREAWEAVSAAYDQALAKAKGE